MPSVVVTARTFQGGKAHSSDCNFRTCGWCVLNIIAFIFLQDLSNNNNISSLHSNDIKCVYPYQTLATFLQY